MKIVFVADDGSQTELEMQRDDLMKLGLSSQLGSDEHRIKSEGLARLQKMIKEFNNDEYHKEVLIESVASLKEK